MERRHFKRIVFGVKAEIVVRGMSVHAVIEDLSEAGVNIITDPVEDISMLDQGTDIELKFQPVDNEFMVLKGKIAWVRKAHPKSTICNVGITLENPPWDTSGCFV